MATKLYKSPIKNLVINYKKDDGSVMRMEFKNHSYTATTPEQIEIMDRLMLKEKEQGKKREIYELIEYEELLFPESSLIEMPTGEKIPKAILSEAYEYAVKKGFKPREFIIKSEEKKVHQGVITTAVELTKSKT